MLQVRATKIPCKFACTPRSTRHNRGMTLLPRLLAALLASASFALPSAAMAQPLDAATACDAERASDRVALVIGNSAYSGLEWAYLGNAANDADAICRALADSGFRVIRLTNGDADAMRAAITRFGDVAAQSEAALVYFAGHGFEYDSVNYLVPVDAPLLASRGELDKAFVPLGLVLRAASRAKSYPMMFMDACRTRDPVVQLTDADPLKKVDSINLPNNWDGVVFYSTTRGSFAFDAAPSGSKVSPFAKAVIDRMARPDLEIASYFRFVKTDVKNLTGAERGGPQIPTPYGAFDEPFFFRTSQSDDEATASEAQAAAAAMMKQQREREAQAVMVNQEERRAREAAVAQAAAQAEAEEDYDSASAVPAPAAAMPPRPSTRPRLPTRGPAAAMTPPPIAVVVGGSGFVTRFTMEQLATIDEPLLVGELLKDTDVQQLQIAAAGGDPVAQYLLGYMYHLGVGVRADKAVAKSWLERSAAQDHPSGLTELGWFLARNADIGPAGDADRARALGLYERAAAKNFAKAQSHLGHALWTGRYGPQDIPRAMDLWEKASQAGHVFATFALGAFEQTPERLATADARLRAIAAKGNIEGDNWLCELYAAQGRAGEVADHCLKAASDGYAGSRAITALNYDRGTGVAPSRKDADYWARLALDLPELEPGYRAQLQSLLMTR